MDCIGTKKYIILWQYMMEVEYEKRSSWEYPMILDCKKCIWRRQDEEAMSDSFTNGMCYGVVRTKLDQRDNRLDGKERVQQQKAGNKNDDAVVSGVKFQKEEKRYGK